LDTAVRQVPLVYEVLMQTPADPPSPDPLADLARHLRAKENPHAAQPN
jgi:flagellum-specific ATP synthase